MPAQTTKAEIAVLENEKQAVSKSIGETEQVPPTELALLHQGAGSPAGKSFT